MPGEGRVEVSLERLTNLLDAITSAPGDFQAWIAAPNSSENLQASSHFRKLSTRCIASPFG
jgi:hypothetical protein